MEVGIVSGLVVIAIAALAAWLRQHLLKPLRRKSTVAARWTIRSFTRRARSAWLERRVRAARRKGESVVWRVRRGPEYATITWRGADEMDTYRFRNFQTYRRVQQTERRTMPTRTSCCGAPPRVGHRAKLAA